MKRPNRREFLQEGLAGLTAGALLVAAPTLVPSTAHAMEWATLTEWSANLFRRVQGYAVANGYVGGAPTLNYVDYHDGRGTVFGSNLIKREVADFMDIPAAQLDLSNQEALFRSVNTFAYTHGYVGGFPTIHQENYHDERGVVFGAILLKREAADFVDIPASQLDVSSSEAIIRSVNWYAFAHGYMGGVPTFNYVDYHDGRGTVFGANLLKRESADFRDIPGADLGIQLPPDQLGTFYTGHIGFDDPIPVGGFAELTLFRDGSYNFTGHFHDSGAVGYNVDFIWAIRGMDGVLYTFHQRGHVAGTFDPGSRDFDWSVSGTSPAIAANWADLASGTAWRWTAQVDLNPGNLKEVIETIAAAIGLVKVIIAIVA